MLNIFEKANKECTCSLDIFEGFFDFKCKWHVLLDVFEVKKALENCNRTVLLFLLGIRQTQ